jgi:hypothetical protein
MFGWQGSWMGLLDFASLYSNAFIFSRCDASSSSWKETSSDDENASVEGVHSFRANID